MSKIDEMIRELCPEGVERVMVKVAFTRLKGTPITAGVMKEIEDEEGDVTIFAGGKTIIKAKEKNIPNANIINVPSVIIQSRGVIDVQYSDTPFTFKNEMWAYTADDSSSVKYLFYYLKENIEVLRRKGAEHGSMPQISLSSTEDYEIPLPPLPIQQEIVSVLDSFTTLIDKMKQEVEKRKKQMEYYREKLLTFEEGECEWKTLKQVAEIGTGSGNTNEGLEEGRYPFYTRGQEILRKNTFEYDEEAIVTAGDGVGVGKVMHYVKGKYALHQRAYRFKPNEGLSTKYLYYYMQVTFYKYVCGNAVASSVSSLRKPKLQVYPVPVPPLPKQSSIVSTLDKFESYISKLEKMIELRQKQYEYYRERLLTF